MRQKTNPRFIDTDTFLPSQFSQDPFAPSQQPQWEDGQAGSQSTSTPVFPRQSQQLFETSAQLSPISFNQSVHSGYQTDGDDYRSQSYVPRNRTPLSGVSGYQSGGIDRFNSLHSTRGGRIKKKPKNKIGTNVEREIKKLQSTTNNLLKLAPFSRVVKETISKVSGGKNFRIQSEALQALMIACEAQLITLFEASYLCTNHAKRVTLKPDDMQLVRRIWSYNF